MDRVRTSSKSEDQMDNEGSLTQEEWAALFDAAIAFKELQCWEWMYDRDMFGVQSPETGEIGYCCVMGQLGEVLGLNVYLGPKGFESYRQLQELAHQGASGDALGPHALLNTQRCVMASFEDRAELHEQDLRLIKSLGLKFRGKKEWPMFQSYRPGYLPWFLTRSEGRFLRHMNGLLQGHCEKTRLGASQEPWQISWLITLKHRPFFFSAKFQP